MTSVSEKSPTVNSEAPNSQLPADVLAMIEAAKAKAKVADEAEKAAIADEIERKAKKSLAWVVSVASQIPEPLRRYATFGGEGNGGRGWIVAIKIPGTAPISVFFDFIDGNWIIRSSNPYRVYSYYILYDQVSNSAEWFDDFEEAFTYAIGFPDYETVQAQLDEREAKEAAKDRRTPAEKWLDEFEGHSKSASNYVYFAIRALYLIARNLEKIADRMERHDL